MDRMEFLQRLQFNDCDPFDKQIKSITDIQGQPFMPNRLGHLGLNLKTALSKFMAQAGFIYGLQQPWSKRPMHLDRSIHDDRSHPLFFY